MRMLKGQGAPLVLHMQRGDGVLPSITNLMLRITFVLRKSLGQAEQAGVYYELRESC